MRQRALATAHEGHHRGYLALLFHGYGHLLYALHKPELDDLVGEFQQVVGDVLTPLTRRRRQATEAQEPFRQLVALRYYEWSQEFFRDAVGLRIGGSTFAKVTSSVSQVDWSACAWKG
jgi:hypothetical protein